MGDGYQYRDQEDSVSYWRERYQDCYKELGLTIKTYEKEIRELKETEWKKMHVKLRIHLGDLPKLLMQEIDKDWK